MTVDETQVQNVQLRAGIRKLEAVIDQLRAEFQDRVDDLAQANHTISRLEAELAECQESGVA